MATASIYAAAASRPARVRPIHKVRRQRPAATVPETEFSWSPNGRTRFAELVALQSLLIPMPCNEDAIVLSHSRQIQKAETRNDSSSGRLLPGNVEREAADQFAFLTAAEKSAGGAAVCIEEVRGGSGVTVRVAMDEGVPQRVVNRLRGICTVLEQAATAGIDKQTARHNIWCRVVDLHAGRIIEMLRKEFMTGGLRECFQEALQVLRGTEKQRRKMKLSRDSFPLTANSKIGDATDMGTALAIKVIFLQCVAVMRKDEKSGREDVRKLLDACYLGRKLRGLKHSMSEQSRRVVSTIEQLGRYKSVAYSLLSLVQKHPQAFSKVSLEPVTLPVRQPFSLPGDLSVGLSSVFSNLSGLSTGDAAEVLQAHTGLTARELQTHYESLYLHKPVIHAEMQLVKFYEELVEMPLNMPRYMGSSDKVCYLCNTFLQLHGGFMVSKSTEVMENRWTVPRINCRGTAGVKKFEGIVERMSRTVEDTCRTAMGVETVDCCAPPVPSQSAPGTAGNGYALAWW